MNIEIETVGPIRMECNNGLNLTTLPAGSFMKFVDIRSYAWTTGVEINISKDDCLLVNNYNFAPTDLIESQLTVEQFRIMQTIVPTYIEFQ